MISYLCKAKTKRYSLAAIFLLFIPPVQAAPLIASSTFNIVDSAIAFVLGIYFLLLSLRLIIKPYTKPDALLLTGITSTLLGVIYSLKVYELNGITLLLAFSTLFLSFCYQWSLLKIICVLKICSDETAAAKANESLSANKRLKIVLGLINAITAVYMLLLYLVPSFNSAGIFIFVNAAILLPTILYTISQPNLLLHKVAYHFFVHWAVSAVLIIVIYLGSDEVISVNGLIYLAFLVFLSALVNGHCELLRVLIDSEDDSGIERVSTEEVFSYMHDPVTNLPTFQQALRCIEKVQHQEGKKKFALIVFKPVNFEKMNAVLGCHNSDILLLQFAYCLQQHVQKDTSLLDFDTKKKGIRIARLQGLHFLLAIDLSMNDHESKLLVNELCKQLSTAIPEALSFKSFSLNFELAFGIAITHGYGGTMPEVIAHATDALLSAEEQQKSQVYYDHNADVFTNRQLLSMDRLKQDINAGNLHWYLQPQINVNDQNIKGFELLVHWYNDDEALALNNFIEIAELSGDIHILTKQMIVQACEMIHQISRLGFTVPVSINLSSGELIEPDIADYIDQALALHQLDPSLLVIELTEAVIIAEGKKIHSMIDQLNELGVGIALDDFSGNYESLRFLRKLAIKQVKINCHLLTHEIEGLTEKAIVNSLINFAHSTKLSLIGTDLNSETAKKVFIAMEGDVAQGKIIKEGVVAEELEVWLKVWFDKYPHSRPFNCSL
jgi:EAL domain-containing protein (putative c-di-GMP-specific phosphodiesterase class I)/GGDEF domain-containing protein